MKRKIVRKKIERSRDNDQGKERKEDKSSGELDRRPKGERKRKIVARKIERKNIRVLEKVGRNRG